MSSLALNQRVPKVMILAPTRPGNGSVGEIFLRDICLGLPQDKVICFICSSASYEVGIESDELEWLPRKLSPMPPENMVKGRFGRMEFEGGDDARRKRIEALAEEALAYAAANDVEVIWTVLAGPTMVELAHAVQQKWRRRFVAHVWDPIEYVMGYFNFSDSARRFVLEKYAEVLSRADCCGVASDGMKAEYELRYRVPCITLVNGCLPKLPEGPSSPLAGPGQFVIGFSGTNYAADAIGSLIQALNSVGWRIAGHEIHLKIMGNTFNFRVDFTGHPANLEFLGFRPVEEAVEFLSRCDMGYVPYWFDARYKLPVRLCFPNKIVQFLAAGIPTLYHGPLDASVTRFYERYPVGPCLHTRTAEDIIAAIEPLVVNPECAREAREACRQALFETINEERFYRSIKALLGAEGGALASAYSSPPAGGAG